MLRLVADVFLQMVTVLTGSKLNAFLLRHLFMESKDKTSDSIREIRTRKPVVISWALCCLLQKSKQHRMLDKGLARIEH